MSMYKDKTPKEQSHEEWWNNYDGKSQKSDVVTPLFENAESKIKTGYFRYLDHRTTCDRWTSVAMEFESVDGSILAVNFYNVSLRSSLGNSYPSGYRGQFATHKRSKFRKFYLQMVGKAPERWSRVHKIMRSRFKGMLFECNYVEDKSKKDELYFKITEIKLIDDTNHTHTGH